LVRCITNQVRAAFAVSVIQTSRTLEAMYGKSPLQEPDPGLRAARSVIHLLDRAVSRDLLEPVWVCPPDYRGRFEVQPIAFVLDATALEGKTVSWSHLGGLEKYLTLLEYCSSLVAHAPKDRRPSDPEETESATLPEDMKAEAPLITASPLLTLEEHPGVRDVIPLSESSFINKEEAEKAATAQQVGPSAGDSGHPAALTRFIADRCIVSPEAMTTAGDLYTAYLAWCQENHELPLVQRSFGMRLTARGLQRRRRGRGRHWWQGIGLATSEAPEGNRPD
jgi:hypothetical protein